MLRSVSRSCVETGCLYRGLEACGWQENSPGTKWATLFQRPTRGYFKSSLKATGCCSLPSHIGHASVHSGSVKTLSSREWWWPISRPPAAPLPQAGYCPPPPAGPLGHLSQCCTLKGEKHGGWEAQYKTTFMTLENIFTFKKNPNKHNI